MTKMITMVDYSYPSLLILITVKLFKKYLVQAIKFSSAIYQIYLTSNETKSVLFFF